MKTSVREPFKGEDGKYQIRIESYDPARNTMKAIWLVSRNQRLLSQLLDKCEVSNSEASNEALRGNLLSVQRELQELRDVMDRHDGTQTPVIDTSTLGLGSTEESETSLLNSWGESSVAESEIQSERASSAFGLFGNRRRSALSLIPKYPRPSIRTDFCVSKFEPFPGIRARPSKIPKCPKKPKRKGMKSMARPKTSLSGRLSSYSGYPPSGRTSILKTSSLNVRPATSMALTRPVTKKVSFGETVIAPRKTCRSKTSSKKPTPKKPIERPATTTGVRSIPRTSSRNSNSSLGIDKSLKKNSMEAPARMRRTPSRTSSNEMTLSKATRKKKTEETELVKKKPAAKASVVKRPGSAKSHVVKTVKTVRSSGKSASKGSGKPRLPLRPKSAVEMRSGAPPSALPFESPPPVPKIHSQPCSFSDLTFPDPSRERSTSPLIRSISIIDDDLENDDPFGSAKMTLPRIRIGEGEQPEYKVKAYFLDEMDDNQSASQLNSGVIPSSPVEVDSNSGRDSEPHVLSSPVETAASINNLTPTVCPNPKQEASAESNKSEEMEVIKNRMPEKELLVCEKDSASVEASSRDHHYDMSFLPEIGMDYLPEFESEVNGLLDTLMSQDLLTSSFSQDFRLFSTESNFMDTLVDSTDNQHPPKQEQLETVERPRQSLDHAENIKDFAKLKTARPHLDQAQTVSAVNATNKDHHSQSSTVSVCAIPENSIMREETENNAFGCSLKDNLRAGADPSTRELRVKDMQDPDLEFCGSDEESPFMLHAGSLPFSSPVKHEVSAVDEIKPHKMPIGDALRRKSTGSYDATALSMSIAAALKPRRYRRSVSQTELDAMLTNNDGYDQRAASPGGQHPEWTGTGVVSTVDIGSFAETCSVLSSSELTVPDPAETYHDVHHGYSPSFAATTADHYGSFRKSLPRSKSMLPTLEWCFFNPVGSNSSLSPTVRQASLHRASFDFLSGNRTQLMENQSDMCKFQPSSPTLRYDTHSTVPIMSTSGAEDLDEIEESSSPDSRPTASKDRFMKPHGSYSPWDENHAKENNRRAAHISEDESLGEDSRIPATVTQETDEDTVEDAQGGSSADGSMDCTNRMEKTENRIQSIRPPSRVHKDSVDMSSQKKKWTKSCGFLRFLTCSTAIEKADRA